MEFCQESEWRNLFPSHAIKYELLAVPPEVSLFLESDGINLDDLPESILSFMSKIDESIGRLGPVIPKLNWCSPKDATWMHPLKCETSRDVLLLLKSSDFIRDDMIRAKSLNQPLQLCLVRHYKLDPSKEFRVFIKNNGIIGISPKDVSNFYPQTPKEVIRRKAQTLLERVVENKVSLERYCIDLYIQKKKSFIMGISPWGEHTDSLLFEWEELERLEDFTFKVVESQRLQPSSYNAFRYPIDMMYTDNLEEFVRNLNT